MATDSIMAEIINVGSVQPSFTQQEVEAYSEKNGANSDGNRSRVSTAGRPAV
jgi:hypothetical protein